MKHNNSPLPTAPVSLRALDPSLSRERLAYTLKDAQATTVPVGTRNYNRVQGLAEVTSRIIDHDEFNSFLAAENSCVPIIPDAPAYIEYASASSGDFKGIMQSHRVKLHRVLRNTNRLHICALDRIAHFFYLVTAWGSQASLNTLMNGASLSLFDVKGEGILPLAHWRRTERMTIYASAPSLFRSLANTLPEPEPLPEIRFVRSNGERIRQAPAMLRRL